MIKTAILCLYHPRRQHHHLHRSDPRQRWPGRSWVQQQRGKKIPQDKNFDEAITIANDVLYNPGEYNYARGATFFKHKRLKNKKNHYLTIGNHVFYK